MLLDHPILSQRYFFPRPGRPPTGAWEVPTRSGHQLVCFRAERGGTHTVVYFHGNGETAADHLPEPAQSWLALGVDLVVATYRGYGGSTGTPQLAAMLEDVECIYQALGLPPQRLVAVGRSLGSLYASELAHRHPDLAGLILESGIADPLERILLRAAPEELGGSLDQLRSEVDERLNQQRKLSNYPGPVLIMHALGDDLVEPQHARQNHAWAAGRKRLVLFERGDHNSILVANRAAYFQEVRDFLGWLAPPGC